MCHYIRENYCFYEISFSNHNKFLSCFLHRCEIIRHKVQRSHPKVDHFQFHPYAEISKTDGEDESQAS